MKLGQNWPVGRGPLANVSRRVVFLALGGKLGRVAWREPGRYRGGKYPDHEQAGFGMDSPASHTAQLQNWLLLLKQGDQDARQRLIEHACERLQLITKKMLRGFPRVRRWEETDDVFVEAVTKLHRSLEAVQPETTQDFYRLATTQIRRVLIDMARRYYGPEGLGAKHETTAGGSESRGAHRWEATDQADEPSNLAEWADFHRHVEALPNEERDVFSLLWYEELTQVEACEVLGISERTLRRRWHGARIHLHKARHGEPLPE